MHVHRGGSGPRARGRQLITELRREPHHGLQVVAACLAGESTATEVAACRWSATSTTPPAWCATSTRARWRSLLPGNGRGEAKDAGLGTGETGTDLCVAPALLDVAARGPRFGRPPG